MSLSPEVEAIQERLHQLSNLLIDLVCDQAEQNPSLRQALMSVFGITSKKKLTRSNYNLFSRFQELNCDFNVLSTELNTKDHEELVLIAMKKKLGKKKDLTSMDKTALAEKLVQYVRGQRESGHRVFYLI